MEIGTNILVNQAKERIDRAENSDDLQSIKKLFLGKKSELAQRLKSVGQLPLEEKKTAGKNLNLIKHQLEQLFQEKEKSLNFQTQTRELVEEVEVSLPGKSNQIGLEHPLIAIKYRIIDFFQSLGFIFLEGPEIETDYYNFEALNIPEGHPARDDQDSFYLEKPYMLRTQTSPMQIRSLELIRPPIAIISPGKVFRRDTIDATHSYCFHQIEGLLVDREVDFTHLKGLLISFCHEFFGHEIKFRFRPDFFPFTEPSCEIAIEYPGKSDGWLEILGAGMVNPTVLKNVDIDPDEYTGCAFGIGIERIAMLLHGIDDIRLFHENDHAFLRQFSGISL